MRARNAELSAMREGMRDKVSYLACRIIILPGRWEEALKDHGDVLDALRRGDADALRRETMHNGLAWLNRFQRFLHAEPDRQHVHPQKHRLKPG